MVAHWFPGFGNPWHMACSTFDDLLRVLPRVMKLSSGTLTQRDMVEMV